MSKELEALYRLATRNSGHRSVEEVDKDFKIVEKALKDYESIDNANPSEALECLEKVYSRLPQWDLSRNVDQCNIIKQVLLKAQEPKHYLKWEDLEKDRTYKVLLNGNQYELVKRYDDYEYHCDYITLQKKPNVSIFFYEWDKEIFNDLRLERVE